MRPAWNPAQFLLDRVDYKPAGSGWQTPCPAHEDHTATLSVGVGREGRVLLTQSSASSSYYELP